MGIVDSLSAGYRFLLRHLELLLVPLLLDGLLWAAPRLSIAPLFARLADLYQGFDSSTPLGTLGEQMPQLLALMGETSNLMEFLVSRSLYHMPSLLIGVPQLKQAHASIQVDSALEAGVVALFLGLVGLAVGVIYMNLLARALPLGEGQKSLTLSLLMGRVVRHWWRTLLFVVGVALLLLIIYIPATIGTTLLMLLSPALGSGAMVLLSGLSMVLFFYLYFVTVGLVLDNLPIAQAVVRSVLLVRNNFWTTLGFVVISGLISLGIGLLIAQLATSGLVGMVVAVMINAFIGTGLALALLVFYRTRLLAMVGQPAKPVGEGV